MPQINRIKLRDKKMTLLGPSSMRLRTLLLISLAICSNFTLSSCTTSPATGKKVISFNSLADEKRIGKREHPKIIRQFGGEYKDPKIKNYVSSLGHRLAQVSELSNIGWKFTVLDTPEINAFAIPGGYIYVTRGLVTLASNEAELAGVISHEIGHITALHSSTRHATSKVAGLGVLAAGILFGQAGSELGNYIGRVSVQQYSQSQELEADSLGVRYLARAGYDSNAMTSFLAKMRASAKLENKKLGRPENSVDQFSIFASHPRTLERIKHTVKTNALLKSGTRLGRIHYMAMLNGIVYGDSLAQGIIRGRHFIHPNLKFRFTVPKGFRLKNKPDFVIATNLDGATIQFDMRTKAYSGSMIKYLKNVWTSNNRLSDLKLITVNDMEGVTAVSKIRRHGKIFDLRLVAVRNHAKQIFHMIFVTRPTKSRQLLTSITNTIYSLRTLREQEAAKIRPFRIVVKAVGRGDSVTSFVEKMALSKFKEETFRILNDLGPKDNIRIGQLVKIVTY